MPNRVERVGFLLTVSSATTNYTLGKTDYGIAEDAYSTDVIARRAVTSISNTAIDQPLLILLVAPYGPRNDPFTPAPRRLDSDVSSYIHDRDFGALNEPDVSDKPLWVRQLNPRSPVDTVHMMARQQHPEAVQRTWMTS